MSELTPRLLNEAEARAYLGGRNPRSIMPPVKLGGRNCWDRVALDQKLDEIFGVSDAPADMQPSALERWRRNKRLSREEAETQELAARIDAMGEASAPAPTKRRR